MTLIELLHLEAEADRAYLLARTPANLASLERAAKRVLEHPDYARERYVAEERRLVRFFRGME